jgi:molybdate transport system ATP-binding protein
MITVQNITFARHGNTIFKNLDLSLKRGEHWVIQGANGSGKTTLLELIAGVLHPQSGSVQYNFITGSDWQVRYQQRQDKICYIPAHALQTFLSGYHNLFYQQRYYSIGDTDIIKVKDVIGHNLTKLEALGFPASLSIGQLLELELTRLSNGQLKKVLILSQLVKKTPLYLLLDYAFEGLDRESRHDLTQFIDHIAQALPVQVIMTDHHHELPTIINRRLLLRDGMIAAFENVTPYTGKATSAQAITTAAATGQLPVVEMKALTIQYGNRTIIDNLNWTIRKGERWALTGKNGSGKTTLFSLIYADHPMAYSQQVFLFGKRRGSGESIWDIKKRVNYLGPEHIHFFNPQSLTATGRQYILAQHRSSKFKVQGSKPAPLPVAEEKLETLITFFEAHTLIDKPVRQLSSGQLQMMMLINFFMSDKELLLLDEPFQFLDDTSKERTTEYLNHYLDGNLTLVLITHYEEDMRRWTQLKMSL